VEAFYLLSYLALGSEQLFDSAMIRAMKTGYSELWFFIEEYFPVLANSYNFEWDKLFMKSLILQ
jgi:hypothetical protein